MVSTRISQRKEEVVEVTALLTKKNGKSGASKQASVEKKVNENKKKPVAKRAALNNSVPKGVEKKSSPDPIPPKVVKKPGPASKSAKPVKAPVVAAITSKRKSSTSAPKIADKKKKRSDEEQFVVEAIRAVKYEKNQFTYFIKWENYPESANTWEPKENLSCQDLVTEFLNAARDDIQS